MCYNNLLILIKCNKIEYLPTYLIIVFARKRYAFDIIKYNKFRFSQNKVLNIF